MTKRILVVEDDRDIRESLQELLVDCGYAVDEAVDGLDAIQRLRADDEPPSLILLDLMMPRMNGIELRAEMAKEERLKSVPVVVLTADVNGRAKAEAMGVAGFLVKPVGLQDLLSVVTKLLSG